MRLTESERARFDAVRVFDANRVGPFNGRAVAVTVAVIERVLRIVEGLDPFVAAIDVVDGVGPAQVLVVADGQHRAAEERRTGEAPAFAAMQMSFVILAEAVVRLVRVAKEHRLVRAGLRRADGPGVAPHGPGRHEGLRVQHFVRHTLRVGRHAVQDVAIERNRVPRLEAFKQPQLLSRVAFDVIVESADERAVERLQLRIKLGEVFPSPLGNLESVRRLVQRKDRGAIELGITAERKHERILDLPEKVLRLRIAEAEDHALIGRAVDMGDAPLVAMNGHLAG